MVMKFPVLLIYLKNYFLINGMLNMKNLKRKISFNEKSFLELKKFRVDERNLFDITISLSGGNEIENIGCLVKEIQLAYDKMCEINILDLSKKGEINCVNAKLEYS